jgi:hypothetical protein
LEYASIQDCPQACEVLTTAQNTQGKTMFIRIVPMLTVTVQTPSFRITMGFAAPYPSYPKQRVVGWVEERNPSIRGESDGGSERLLLTRLGRRNHEVRENPVLYGKFDYDDNDNDNDNE